LSTYIVITSSFVRKSIILLAIRATWGLQLHSRSEGPAPGCSGRRVPHIGIDQRATERKLGVFKHFKKSQVCIVGMLGYIMWYNPRGTSRAGVAKGRFMHGKKV
jgi:hypothetical protein